MQQHLTLRTLVSPIAAAMVAAGLLLGLSALTAMAAPDLELWERWLANDPDSRITVDHTLWNQLLTDHVRRGEGGINQFDYAGIDAAERAALDGYVADLAAAPISSCRRDEQLVYWINLYNALTITVILDHFPVESIRDIDISPGMFSSGPWGAKLITIEGEELSLDDIEHRILRPIWRDPRVHYAVNCAAYGCPDLADRAYQRENADSMLERAARTYINHPRGVLITGDGVVLSKIYDWYGEDFGDSDAGILDHIRHYAKPPLARALEDVYEVDGYRYDWRLNNATVAADPD